MARSRRRADRISNTFDEEKDENDDNKNTNVRVLIEKDWGGVIEPINFNGWFKILRPDLKWVFHEKKIFLEKGRKL